MNKLLAILVLVITCQLIESHCLGSLLNCFRGQADEPRPLTGGEILDQLLNSRNRDISIDSDSVFADLRNVLNNLISRGSRDETSKKVIEIFLGLEEYHKKDIVCNLEAAKTLWENKFLFNESRKNNRIRKKVGKERNVAETDSITFKVYSDIKNNFNAACKDTYIRPFYEVTRSTEKVSFDGLLKDDALTSIVYDHLMKSHYPVLEWKGSSTTILHPMSLVMPSPQEITESDVGYLINCIKNEAISELDLETLTLFNSKRKHIDDVSEQICDRIKSSFFETCNKLENQYKKVFDSFSLVANEFDKFEVELNDHFYITYAHYIICRTLTRDTNICDKVRNFIQHLKQ